MIANGTKKCSEVICCLHDLPVSLEQCETSCPRYYGCDTAAWASDEEAAVETVGERCGRVERGGA